MDDIDRLQDMGDARMASRLEQIAKSLAASASPICVDCDEDIEPERLAKLPSAKRCLFCQGTLEKEAKLRRRR